MTHQTWISGKAIRPLFAEPVTFQDVPLHHLLCTVNLHLSNLVGSRVFSDNRKVWMIETTPLKYAHFKQHTQII